MALSIETVIDPDASWDDLVRLFLAFEDYNQPFQPRTLAADWQERLRQRLRAHDDRLIQIARVDGVAVGQAVAVIRRDEGLVGEDYGYLSHVYVAEAHRRQGIGRELLNRAEAWCLQRGANRLELDVLSQNADGRRFWTKAGFEAYSLSMQKALD